MFCVIEVMEQLPRLKLIVLAKKIAETHVPPIIKVGPPFGTTITSNQSFT